MKTAWARLMRAQAVLAEKVDPMMPFAAHLARPEVLSALQGLGAGRECYLVGGALRDWLQGRTITDLDLATPDDPTPLARGLAAQLGGHWFWLDRPRRQSRVLVGEGRAKLSLDFAPFRAPTLAADLAARDFTINAMALDLGLPLLRENLIDPLGGYRDLRARVLRTTGAAAFRDDPLRLLRGVRHALELALTMSDETVQGMLATSLGAVAVERIRQEVWRMFIAPGSDRLVALLQVSGAGQQLWGDAFGRSTDRLQAMTLRSRHCQAGLVAGLPAAAGLLREPCEEGLDRGALVLWSLWLRILAADVTDGAAALWRCSRRTARRLRTLVELRPEDEADLARVVRRPRPLALWAARLGVDRYDPLLAMALLSPRPEDDAVAELVPLLAELAACRETAPAASLVDGRWIEAELGVAGGTAVGRLLAQLRDAEIYGAVTSVAEAREFLRAAVQKNH